RSPAAAGGERRGRLVEDGLGGALAGGAARQEGEGQQPSVPVDNGARQGVDAGEGARLGPDDAGRAVGVAAGEGAGETGHRQPGEGGAQLGVGGVAGLHQQGGEQVGGEPVAAVETAAVLEDGAFHGQPQLLELCGDGRTGSVEVGGPGGGAGGVAGEGLGDVVVAVGQHALGEDGQRGRGDGGEGAGAGRRL